MKKNPLKDTYKARIKIEEQHRSFLPFRKNVIDFFGLNDKAKKPPRKTFVGKTENLDISTQQQLGLELPVLLASDGESELNGK